ncbi:GNAT family N-acetyltransferase [Allosalinactinospora lopnorensis]|uniref:GNAT family N-acetyltransferase n=1 Tax=Allosalinactinospora lopnorensis TaxID=1352348 RepID=UPI000623FF13|nr:GNAT family N-acetyltransferase [Allosalinactinospora lopnorensis]
MTGLCFRPARPQDAAAVVPLMRASSPALVDAVFGERAAGVLHHDFLRGRGLFGYRHQTIGVAPDGGIVATITAYDGVRYRRLLLRTMLSAARCCGPVRFLGSLLSAAALGRQFVPPGRDAVYLANLCVDAGHRSRGYGAALMEHVIRAAGDRGLRQTELDVSRTNPRAQKLYERMGFTIAAECPDTGGIPGTRRMRRPIGHRR